MTSARVEHYLKAIYQLGGKEQPVSLSALANELLISQVSTNEMIKKLTEQDLVSYEPYRGVVLTSTGYAQALVVTRRHRLWERFLADYLGISWDRVHQEACSLEHATSPLLEDRLAQFLGQPEACPHGHPVPDSQGDIIQAITHPLSALEPGQVGIVHSVREEPELLKYLDSVGLVPQARVHIESTAPFEGPLTVWVGDAQHVLGWKVASLVQVCLC